MRLQKIIIVTILLVCPLLAQTPTSTPRIDRNVIVSVNLATKKNPSSYYLPPRPGKKFFIDPDHPNKWTNPCVSPAPTPVPTPK